MMHIAWSSIEEVPYCFWRSSVKFQGHRKIDDLNPIWVRLLGRSQLSNPSDLPCSWMGTFAVFIQITFFKWLTKDKLPFMQMTWGRVGGNPLHVYAEYQIYIGNTNSRATCPMNYVLLTSNSPLIHLNNGTVLDIGRQNTTKYCAVPISRGHFFSTEIILYTPKSYQTHGRDTGFPFFAFKPDLCFTSVNVQLYAISGYTGLRYQGVNPTR